MGTMQTGRSWHRLPLPNVVAAFLLSAFIVGYVAPAALAVADDLTVTLGGSPDPVNVGGQVTYTATAAYDSLSAVPATGVQVVFTIPTEMTFVSASATCAAPAPNVVCSLPDLSPGTNANATMTLAATQAAVPSVAVTATVSTSTPGDAPGNNTDSATTIVNPVADLGLSKTATPTTAYAGQDVTFTLTTHNNGPSPAVNVVVTDTLPAGLTFKSATGCTNSGQTVTCGPTASLGFPSIDLVHTIVATVAPTATGSLQNTATVASTNPGATSDPVVANNTATATVAVTAPPAELALALADDPDPVGPGMDLDYTITITSTGPNDAPNVAVTANVPAGTTFASADGGGTLSGSAVNWTVPSIAKNTTATLHYTVHVNDDVSASTLNATATLTYGGDTKPADNSATADTAVGGAEADLVVVIAADDLNPGKDGAVTFTVGVGNAGPQDISGVVVTAKLPKGISFDRATDPALAIAAPNAYDPSTGRWDPVDLVAGGSVTFTLSGTVTTANPVTVRADAILPSGFTDPTPANATDSVILNQADTGGSGGGNGGGGGGTGSGSTGGTGGTGATNDGTAFTGFTATQLMPWLAFFMILGLSSVEFARRRGHVLPVGSTYGFEPWIT